MQNPNLIRIIKTLNDRPKAAITVFDSNNPMKKYSNLTKQALEETYGGINQFFEFLIEEGTTEIVVQPRLSNGTNFINLPGFNQFKVTIGALGRNEMPTMLNAPIQQPSTTSMAVNEPLPMSGMSDTDVIKFRAFDWGRMSNEYNQIKSDFEKLKQKFDDLKEVHQNKLLEFKEEKTALENQIEKTEEKGRGLNGFVEKNETVINTLIGAFAEKLLAAPSATASSPAKQEIINVINKNDDSIAEYVNVIFKGLNIPSFAQELDAIIQKHNLVNNH